MGGFSFSHRCEQEGAFLARSFLTLVEVLSAEWTNFYKSFPFFTFDNFVQVNYVLGNFLFIVERIAYCQYIIVISISILFNSINFIDVSIEVTFSTGKLVLSHSPKN